MAKCKYLLKLPGGKTIELSAGFGTLEEDKEINDFFLAYKEEQDEEKKNTFLSKLTELIKDKLDDFEIHGTVLNNIIKKSENTSDVYSKINNLIEQSGSYNNIESAVRRYIREDVSKGNINKKVADLKKALMAPKNPKYFQDLGVTGVLGSTSLKDEKNRIYSKNLENKEFGFNTEITENLHTFLSALNSKYFAMNKSNILYGVKGAFTGKAWSNDDITIYEMDDDLSLFLGLFKKEAVQVDPLLLIPILEKINSKIQTRKNDKIRVKLDDFSVEEFFRGKVENNKVFPSRFEKLLEDAKEHDISLEIDSIIRLVSKSINPDKIGLTRAMQSLFWQLTPNSYGRDNLLKQTHDIKFVEEEAKIEQAYKMSQLSFLEMDSKVRNMHFGLAETINENVYENAIKNIILNKDIVKFPEGDKGTYGLVTHIYDRGNGTVAIYGVYKNSFGELKDVKATFKAGELIYRKRELAIDPYVQDELVVPKEGALIKSEIPLDQKVVKELVRRGDLINGDLVVGIFPAYISTKRRDGTINKDNYYSHITSLSSAIALQRIHEEEWTKISSYKGFTQVKNGEDLSKGDLFLFQEDGKKFYKHVVFTDEDNVYSWVRAKDGNYIIKATPKTGLQGLRNTQGEMSNEEISKIAEEVLHIARSSAKMSSFSDVATAQPGDFVYFEDDNGKKSYGKVLENNKLLLFEKGLTNRLVTSLDYFERNGIIPQFFTNRDISSNYALFTIRANNWNVEFKKEPESKLDVEVRYVIPNTITPEQLASRVTFPNGYCNIGSYKAIGFIDKNDIDITDIILKDMKQLPGTKVFVKKETTKKGDSNLYQRNLTSLVQMTYFDSLDPETKSDLNVIVPGTYFSLYKANSPDRNIYRIISVKGDIVKAQLNKLSPEGKIITNEVDLSLKTLLQTKKEKGNSPEGSIAKLYLITGNTKVSAVFDKTNELLDKEDVEGRVGTNKSINLLISKFKGYVKGLGVNIKLVPHSEVFKNKQFAAIVSEVVPATEVIDGQPVTMERPETLKTSILISDEIGRTSDVMHEFLHLFLIPLRYKHPEIYNAFIQSVVKDDSLNITEAEEKFVNHVVKKITRKEDFIENFENMQTFVNGLKTIIKGVNPEFEIDSEENPVELLKTSLMDLFEIDKNDNSHPMYNLGMVVTEPAMREWMENNNITLKCS